MENYVMPWIRIKEIILRIDVLLKKNNSYIKMPLDNLLNIINNKDVESLLSNHFAFFGTTGSVSDVALVTSEDGNWIDHPENKELDNLLDDLYELFKSLE